MLWRQYDEARELPSVFSHVEAVIDLDKKGLSREVGEQPVGSESIIQPEVKNQLGRCTWEQRGPG